MIFKRTLKTTAIIFLLIILSGCNTSKDSVSTLESKESLTDEQWIEDIEYLEEKLPRILAKEIYNTLEEEGFSKGITQLKARVSELQDYEIKYELTKLIAKSGEGHTRLDNQLYEEEKRYPLETYWFGDELRLVKTDKRKKELIGKELLSINDISVDEIVKRMDSIISHDTNQWVKSQSRRYILRPKALKFLDITKEDTIKVKFKNEEEGIFEVAMAPQKIESDNMVSIKDIMEEKSIQYRRDTRADMKDNPNFYWYKYIKEDKILYLQYNKCMDKSIVHESVEEYTKSIPDIKKFSNRLVDYINNNDVERLIVDLRFNGGGYTRITHTLVSKLKEVNKLRGRIFIITGKNTFSAGVKAAATFKEELGATSVGEATGENVNFYASGLKLILPNSKIGIMCSNVYMPSYANYPRNFIPNVAVEQSFKNYLKGIDDAYEEIKKLDIIEW